MCNIAAAFKHISDLIDAPQKHKLTSQQIEALATAQKALLIIELFGMYGENAKIT